MFIIIGIDDRALNIGCNVHNISRYNLLDFSQYFWFDLFTLVINLNVSLMWQYTTCLQIDHITRCTCFTQGASPYSKDGTQGKLTQDFFCT